MNCIPEEVIKVLVAATRLARPEICDMNIIVAVHPPPPTASLIGEMEMPGGYKILSYITIENDAVEPWATLWLGAITAVTSIVFKEDNPTYLFEGDAENNYSTANMPRLVRDSLAQTKRGHYGSMGTVSQNMTDVLATESVSPVTLSDHWSRLARLILLASLSAVGSVGNVFMISAVMIEDYLRKRGNTFVVNVALADFLVSGLVVPASAVVILAGLKDNLAVCRFQWFIAVLCFLVTVLSLAAVATENYFRLCYSSNFYEQLTRRKITVLLLIIWAIGTCISGIQFAPDLSFDYCTRKYPGLIPYQATVCVVLVFLPMMVTFFCYVRAGYQVRSYKGRSSFKAPITFNWDYSLMQANMFSFILFVVFWLPFGVVLAVGTVRSIPDSLFYNLAWLAISKSCFNSILYCITNRHFRGAYVNLFHYCCCKTTVSFSRRQRPECVRPSGDVRVHIIPGYNMYCSPQRSRETQSKRCSTRHNGRDIYEL